MADKPITGHSRAFKDLTGQRFGKLVVLSRGSNKVYPSGYTKVQWNCICDCGGYTTALAGNIARGKTQSCGCGEKENLRKIWQQPIHNGKGTPEYSIWNDMISRCSNSNKASYKHYGGRGISVCSEWRHDFAAFLDHVGKRPGPEFSIDRIDNDGNYEPGNVRWATRSQQVLNRRRKTHCKRGHEFSPENTRIAKNGGRVCRKCMKEHQKRWMAEPKNAQRAREAHRRWKSKQGK